MKEMEEQLMELQLIESMYPRQMMFFRENIQKLVESSDVSMMLHECRPCDDDLPIEFVFTLPSTMMEIFFTLPESYPVKDKLSLHVRITDGKMSSGLLKKKQSEANECLSRLLSEAETPSDFNVLSVIQWVEEFERNLKTEESSFHHLPSTELDDRLTGKVKDTQRSESDSEDSSFDEEVTRREEASQRLSSTTSEQEGKNNNIHTIEGMMTNFSCVAGKGL